MKVLKQRQEKKKPYQNKAKLQLRIGNFGLKIMQLSTCCDGPRVFSLVMDEPHYRGCLYLKED